MKLVNLVPLKELDINDPALVKYRASRTVNKADNPMDKPSKPTRDLTYAKKLKLRSYVFFPISFLSTNKCAAVSKCVCWM